MDISNYRTTIETPRLTLRTLEMSDASDAYAGWLNDPVVNKYLETRNATVDEIQRYIGDKLASPNALFLGIFWKVSAICPPLLGGEGVRVVDRSKHIGTVKLEPINFDNGVATLGLLIGDKEYWGRGVATEATNVIVDFAFNTLGLREVNLGVLADNAAAIRVYEKCGFTVTSRDLNSIAHGGYEQVWMKKVKSDKSTNK